MNYIVLDLEWNQGSGDKDLNFEIIEIGAIKLNSEREKVSEFSQLVKPQVYHELHYITEKLLHMKMKEVETGRIFQDVYRDFSKWCGEDYIFCTWGPLDLTELEKNIEFYQLTPLTQGPLPFLDIQKLFSIAYEDRKSRRSLEYAVDYLKLEKDIPFHRAYADAYYTAKVFRTIKNPQLLDNVSYDVHVPPKSEKDEVFVIFDTYAKYISREFPDKTSAMADRKVNSTKCYLCKKNLRKKIRWFSGNGKHYYAVSYCDKHGFMKSKIRFHKIEGERVFVVKTMKLIPKEDVEKIRDKQIRAKDLRKKKRLSK